MRSRLRSLRGSRASLPVLFSLALLATACSGDAGRLAQERGKLVFTKGQSPSSGPFTVTMQLFGDAEREFPATRYACVNCHGYDGLPRMEGGVSVPNIQPHSLASPSRGGDGISRVRVAYDENLLRRAITMGIDASGNKLDTLMPRFNISDRDLDDLLAYMQVLGSDHVPGVTDVEARIVTVLPGGREDRSVAMALRETLTAFVEETNDGGGLYGRTLHLEVVSNSEWAEIAEAAVGDYLCVLAPYGALSSLPAGMPVIGTIQPEMAMDPPLQEQVFHLYPSQLAQLRVAVDHWCDVLKHESAAFRLVVPDGVDRVAAAKAVARQVRKYPGATLLGYDEQMEASTGAPEIVLLMGPPEFKEGVLEEVGHRDEVEAVYTTHLLPPGSVLGLGRSVQDKLRILLPVPLPAVGDPGVRVFREFLERHQLPETEVPVRVAGFAAGSVLVECLKRCGARLTRERLLEILQSLHNFRPGLFPPVSFDLNRRVGALGAQVVRFDPETGALEPLSEWSQPK